IEQNIHGSTINVLETKSAVPGNNVALTIDLELQKIAEESLESTIKSISTRSESYGASAGAVVVIDVNNGEILAIASYPTYNQNTFNEDYKTLYENEAKPMWNRAISGTYAPGSTFKMLTAVAALESGVISTSEKINDTGIYKYYESSGYSPVCWYFSDYGIGHGPQNVTQAIENSCNYYFYEVGRRMGIDNLAKYGKKFGLGEYTGIELTGESKGIFASKEYRKKIGSVWYPGDTLQAAIGQSDHLFTPLQLANYVATLANGGTRYNVHIIKEVKSGTDSKVILSNQPEAIDKVDISKTNYDAIMNGMKAVSETGTASNVFASFEISVGGKTGTASVSKGTANALFVATAPLENPQIAIAIVVEHGGHGNYVAPIAKNIISYYINPKITDGKNKVTNTLIP
ncbi:MAG: penicillin-binding protein 2, partial [Clostridia bacterium]|nr:penicillin-binding protein 2 [Clostridia bacterium]